LELKDKIHVNYLPSTPKALTTGGKALFLVFGPLKVLFQIYSLFRLLLIVPQFSYILVQVQFHLHFLYENPPSIPTIVVARVVCSLRSARLVIDWHNLGYTLLALRLSPSHPLVQLHRIYEHYFSKCAYAHFCVTNLMRRHLMNQYGLENVTTLMDRPPDRFSPLNASAQSLFLTTLPETARIDRSQTKILVTSTSYTADEPLAPLLSALLKYSETPAALPRVLLLITGRGPMQEDYRQMIAKSSLNGKGSNDRCTVKMVWLEPEDYPRLLACADLGISLHTSSSGMDFPMKIIDLFGSGVPVCAIQFEAFLSPVCSLTRRVGEVVQEGVNGVIFKTSDELYEALVVSSRQKFRLTKNLLSDDHELERLRLGVRNFECGTWSEEWDKLAKPVFA
jgi:beta-1,4-mannosyltransferase